MNSSVKLLLDKAQTCYNNEKYTNAVKLYKTALVMENDFDVQTRIALYIGIANAYYKLDNVEKYAYYYEQYLKDCPNGQLSVFSRLGHAYYYLDNEKSVYYHNKALNIEVNRYNTASKLFTMTKSPSYSQEDIKDETEYDVDLLRASCFNNIKKYTHNKNKDKKLNIGYLSSDCYTHTVMSYILPIWENHNKDEFNFFIFNCASKEDATTEIIKKLGFEIIKCTNMDDNELAKAIYDKDIDILIDLGGFTHLKVFSLFYKPAPIIISYLGYLNTLGMNEVDYILADKFVIPEDKADLYTEKPLYLKSGYNIFVKKDDYPDIDDCPFIKNGFITFGSFNCQSKLSDTSIFIWSEVLKKVENSKILIYRTNLAKKTIKRIKYKFIGFGISPDRIIFSSKKYTPHLKAYLLADISLDSFPFGGMSIATENALMGVATITLLGEGMQSRCTARVNNAIGLDYLNAYTGDEFVKIAAELANNKSKLIELRKTLRDKVYNSSLVNNPKGFTLELESKFKEVWNDYISKQK